MAEFMSGTGINWDDYNNSVKECFWVCGSTLQSLVQDEGKALRTILGSLKEKILQANKPDDCLRIIFPATRDRPAKDNSRIQLDEFDNYKKLTGTQYDLANKSYEMARKILFAECKGTNIDCNNLIKRFSGIMYKNITRYDNNCIVRLYEPVGDGKLAFKIISTDNVWDKIKEEFDFMWKKAVPDKPKYH